MHRDPYTRIPIGISSCLLGEAVRYDGGHKRNALIVDVLGEYFEYLPYCPEVAIGMGTPRPPIRLVGDPSRPRAVGVENDTVDVTEEIIGYAHSVVAASPPMSGYVFKSGSPSCGVAGVKVYDGERPREEGASGLYAGVLMDSLPSLPVEEESRLDDPVILEDFVKRVIVYDCRRRLGEGKIDESELEEHMELCRRSGDALELVADYLNNQ